MKSYRQGVPYDKCVGCGKEFMTYQLTYDGVEPDCHDPKCYWCLIKEAQKIYGVDNVEIPQISKN